MDLSFTAGLAELLEEQRRRRRLLEEPEPVERTPAGAATSPVLTPELSTNGALTPAPSGTAATFSGSSSPANRLGGTVAPAVASAAERYVARHGTGNNDLRAAELGSTGVGYGMSAAAEEAQGLEADINAAGAAQRNAADLARLAPAAKDGAPPLSSGAELRGPDMSGLAPIVGEGRTTPEWTPDPSINYSAAIADRRANGPARDLVQRAAAIEGKDQPIVPVRHAPIAFDEERHASNVKRGELERQHGLGKALEAAGVAPPPPPADPLAPKPKLTARQRAEAEVPKADDLKGWQRLLLVMGAGLAGGLAKDASLGAKLAAMTPQNRREALVKERIEEIQREDKLELDRRQTEAQIDATVKGTERADKEQVFSQGLQRANLEINLKRLGVDIERLAVDKDVRKMDAETRRRVQEQRMAYNERILKIREDAVKQGKVVPDGADLIDVSTGQILYQNPKDPVTTSTTSSEVTTGPDGKQYRVDKTDTSTKAAGGTRDASNPAAEASARAKVADRRRRMHHAELVRSKKITDTNYDSWKGAAGVEDYLRSQGL